MIRVLIADDHSIVRKGLIQLCASMGNVIVAGEAANGNEVIEALQREKFDLLLLDLTMPGVNEIDLVERIRALQKELRILVFSMHNEMQLAKRLIKMGVTGYISKGSGDEMLMIAIRKVAAGTPFIDPVFAEQIMFERHAESEVVATEHLSKREMQILKLLGQGMGVNAIADKLFINSRTVSTYKARLMLKMNFKNNAELVRYTVESGLFESGV